MKQLFIILTFTLYSYEVLVTSQTPTGVYQLEEIKIILPPGVKTRKRRFRLAQPIWYVKEINK